MPCIAGTTNQQSAFLRAFCCHPDGPPPQQWPSPTVMRRWLAKPAFRRALLEIRQAIEFQARFHLTGASVGAAYALVDAKGASAASAQAPPSTAQHDRNLLRLIERRQNR